jgi:hypothetical protein
LVNSKALKYYDSLPAGHPASKKWVAVANLTAIAGSIRDILKLIIYGNS